MTGDVVALDTVLRQQHADADEEDQQLGLFATPQTAAGVLKAGVRGPGRPPGARNKRTERTTAFLLARHRDPREVLLEIAEANVADLAALYACSLMEAGQEKRLAAAAVLPYVASRMPLQLDVTKRSVVYLNIVDGQSQQVDPGDGIGLVASVLNNVEYQEVSDASNIASNIDGDAAC